MSKEYEIKTKMEMEQWLQLKVLLLLGQLESCYLLGELAFGGERGDKDLVGGGESTGENCF